jgi:hypothetical protein
MSTELQKDIMKAVHKVNKMRIDSGQSQYMGRGPISDSEIGNESESDQEPVQVEQTDQRENIYDQEEVNSLQAAKDIMNSIKQRVESVNLGQSDTTKLIKKLNKVNDMLGSAAVGGESDLKQKLKQLKKVDPKLYYKLKSKLDMEPKKKTPKGKGKPKREMSDKQRGWIQFVNDLAKKDKYKDMKRKDLMKIASEKYKKQK